MTSTRIELVHIQPGSFMMGRSHPVAPCRIYDDSGAFRYLVDEEAPVHQVTINYDFYLGKYEVTQTQWQAVMGSNPSKFKDCPDCPVESVSWEDAQNFIRKLNQKNDGYVYRLPTEAEWEYACRAGTTTEFAFGDKLRPDQANFDALVYTDNGPVPGLYRTENGFISGFCREKTTPVASFPPNPWGLFDMHGNVYEWCEDWYHESYDGAPTDGGAWLTGGEQKEKVVRGGSWGRHAGYARSSARRGGTPDRVDNEYGFRVVAVARAQ